jgi:hypothetical protein
MRIARRPATTVLRFLLPALLLAGISGVARAQRDADWCVRLAGEAASSGSSTASPKASSQGSGKATRGGSTVRPQPAAKMVDLDLVSARWQLDVFGSMSTGRVDLEFINPHEFSQDARWLAPQPPGLRLTGAAIVTKDGESTEAKLAPYRRQRSRGSGSIPTNLQVMEPSVDLAPGASVIVRIFFEQTLGYVDGEYRGALPVVRTGCRRDDQGEAAPRSVLLSVHHVDPLSYIESPTHTISLSEFSGRTTVELDLERDTADEAFQVVHAFDPVEAAQAAGQVGPADDQGAREVLLTIQPPAQPPRTRVRAKEAIFVVDSSGSMKGGKLDAALEALSLCLEGLDSRDSFNLIDFDSAVRPFLPAPVPASASRLADAQSWATGLEAEGGTQLGPALGLALSQEADDTLHRLVVVVTDGAIGDEEAVLKLLEEQLGNARLLMVGIGAQARSTSVERVASFGRGDAIFPSDAEDLGTAMERLFGSFSQPVAWDLALDWGGAEVEWVRPHRMPDLYAGRPVTVLARVTGNLPPTLRIAGATTDGADALQLEVDLDIYQEVPALQQVGRLEAARRRGIESERQATAQQRQRRSRRP